MLNCSWASRQLTNVRSKRRSWSFILQRGGACAAARAPPIQFSCNDARCDACAVDTALGQKHCTGIAPPSLARVQQTDSNGDLMITTQEEDEGEKANEGARVHQPARGREKGRKGVCINFSLSLSLSLSVSCCVLPRRPKCSSGVRRVASPQNKSRAHGVPSSFNDSLSRSLAVGGAEGVCVSLSPSLETQKHARSVFKKKEDKGGKGEHMCFLSAHGRRMSSEARVVCVCV